MKKIINAFKPAALLLLALGIFAGCESTDGGGSYNSIAYYGNSWYGNPYYYDRDDDNDNNVIVRPPPDSRPERPGAIRPSHPIARPTPSIPMTPRPAARSGGGGRRR